MKRDSWHKHSKNLAHHYDIIRYDVTKLNVREKVTGSKRSLLFVPEINQKIKTN